MATLQVYNTLTRCKEPLRTIEPGRVRMYVCGVTVYAPCHVGHARAGMAFDVVFRYLLHKGYDVSYARNFTDVDDKIIARANAEGVSFQEIAQRYIADFHRSMDGIFLLRPDHEPRCTEHMDRILEMVGTLLLRGHAYQVGGDVYFDVSSMPRYGRLSRRSVEEQEEGARVDVDERKRHPFDFALWKAARPGEPSWPSPWGDGRPGWHIECSAMSSALLGPCFDIHGGGIDLVFPHHENEIAQSECAHGQGEWVHTWLHNGHLTIDAEKMSKSLGNCFTVSDIIARYHPESLRVFYMSAHYRGPLDYSQAAMDEAEQKVERLYATLAEIDRRLGDTIPRPQADPDGARRRRHLYSPEADPIDEATDPCALDGRDRGVLEQTRGLTARFERCMDDDFNTAGALGELFNYVRLLNKWLASNPDLARPELRAIARAARDRFQRVGSVLGLFHEEPAGFFERLRQRRLGFVGMSEASILDAIERRNAARARKDWAEGDAIRDELSSKGIALKDGPAGTDWVVTRSIIPGGVCD